MKHYEQKMSGKEKLIVVLIGLILLGIFAYSNPKYTGPEYSGVSHCCGY